jgi:hypothetical protein
MHRREEYLLFGKREEVYPTTLLLIAETSQKDDKNLY